MKKIIEYTIYFIVILLISYNFLSYFVQIIQNTYDWYYFYSRKENTHTVEGKISLKYMRKAYNYEITYIDSLNNEHKIYNNFRTNFYDRWKVGDSVELIYHSNNLKTIRINTIEEIIGVDLPAMFFLVVFNIAGLSLVIHFFLKIYKAILYYPNYVEETDDSDVK